MQKPNAAHFNLRRETSTLFFPDNSDVEFYMRGAVYWPQQDNGFALLAGQDVKSQVVNVFEQQEFMTVEDIFRGDQIEFHGLGPWLNRCWARYYANKYFFFQPEETHRRFRLQLYRSGTTKPAPVFIEAPLEDDKDCWPVILEYVRTGRLLLAKDSQLARGLELMRQDAKAEPPPILALGRLLVGLERWPFKRGHIEEEGRDYVIG